MTLDEITNAANIPTVGTYAGIRFSTDTIQQLTEYITLNNIPHSVNATEFHTTLLYSRKKLPNYTAKEYNIPWIGKHAHLVVFDGTDNTNNILVLAYECEQLSDRHKFLLDKHNTTYDYDEYLPHITLSYNFAGSDISEFTTPTFNIECVSEYKEDLQTEYAK